MAFKLVIECSKDIDKLQIDFSDGTSVVTHSEKESTQELNQTSKHEQNEKSKNLNEHIHDPSSKHNNSRDFVLDADADFSTSINQEIVQKPQIPDRIGEVSVAEELQHLDI